MGGMFLLSESRMAWTERDFPPLRGLLHVDDGRRLRGIGYVIRNGFRWKPA